MKKNESMKGTAKERVRAVYPTAWCYGGGFSEVILPGKRALHFEATDRVLGSGSSPRAAWSAAARSLKGKK